MSIITDMSPSIVDFYLSVSLYRYLAHNNVHSAFAVNGDDKLLLYCPISWMVHLADLYLNFQFVHDCPCTILVLLLEL